MHKNLQIRPKLLIVSDTAMKKDRIQVEAFEPVIREIEHFSRLFEKIMWIGYDYSKDASRKNMRETKVDNIEYVILPRTGGAIWHKKILHIYKMIPYFFLILKMIKQHDVIHTRAPSMPAFLAIVISLFDKKRIYWHKYAGSWIDRNAPLFSKLQRFLLKRATNTHVTINGKWPDQQKHILTFENPCLTEDEYNAAKKTIGKRSFSGKLNFCFIGNLNDAKGVGRIIEAFQNIQNERIGSIHFIGDGAERERYERMAEGLPALFHGFMLRDDIDTLLQKMHFLLLPSASEGFPKVIAESSAFGVIPVVTAVSSIPQYVIDNENGFLIDEVSEKSTIETLKRVLRTDTRHLEKVSSKAMNLPKKFTYEYYTNRIEHEILS